MSDNISRNLFRLELVVFALPCIGFMLLYGALLGGGGLFFAGGLLVGFLRSLARGEPVTAAGAWEVIQAVAFYGGAGLVAIAGVVALCKFVAVSFDFARHGRAVLPELAKPLRRALLWSAVPLAIWMPSVMFSLWSEHLEDRIPALVLSGLPLFVPILHLGLELRRQGEGRMS